MGGIRNFGVILLLCMISLAMSFLVFPRTGIWWLAYVCLVPWLLAVGFAAKARHAYIGSYLFGAGYFALNAHWLMPITIPGYVTLCLFFGWVAPLAALGIRQAKRRGVPLALAAPVAWVAFEYLRSIGGLAFPVNLLGHTQYRQLSVIQIADLVGAYGVSFVLVMVNGLLVDLMTLPIVMDRREGRPKLSIGIIATAATVSLTLIYGSAQKSEKYLADGPAIAIMQHDIIKQVPPVPRRQFEQGELFSAHLELTRQAAAQSPTPSLVLMPEAMIPFIYPNPEFLQYGPDDLTLIYNDRLAYSQNKSIVKQIQQLSRRQIQDFQQLATSSGIPLVLGSGAYRVDRNYDPPRVGAFNSAYLIEPESALPTTVYDKRHLVLFGEYIPFRYSMPWIYQQLNGLTPFAAFGSHYSQAAGTDAPVFEIPISASDGSPLRAGTPICYEELMPYICRAFVRPADNGDQKNVDILLCLSNDGWFFHSSELEQHLAGGVFRAVENRIALARSVNTGGSAIIDPNGRISTRVAADARRLENLDEVEKSLQSLRSSCEKLRSVKKDSSKFQDAYAEAKRTLRDRLRRAWRFVGSEFELYGNRLERLLGNVRPNNPLWQTSAEFLIEQIDDDLQMIRRWRDLPWQMPGVAVGKAKMDVRITLYTRWGDWFAQGLVLITSLLFVDRVGLRWRRRRLRRQATESNS